VRVLVECGSRFSDLVRAERTGLRIPSTPDLGHTHPLVQCVMGKGVVKLATHLRLVPRIRMRGAIPPLSHTPLRRVTGEFYVVILGFVYCSAEKPSILHVTT